MKYSGILEGRPVDIIVNSDVILDKINNDIDWEIHNDKVDFYGVTCSEEEIKEEVQKLKVFLSFLEMNEGIEFMFKKVVLTKAKSVSLKERPLLYAMPIGHYSNDYYGWFRYELRLEPDNYKQLTLKLKEIVRHH